MRVLTRWKSSTSGLSSACVALNMIMRTMSSPALDIFKSGAVEAYASLPEEIGTILVQNYLVTNPPSTTTVCALENHYWGALG